MKIFVIIVTWNAMRRQWIQRCLDSLMSSTYSCIPVVVDNASTDDTVSFIDSQYPAVILLKQTENWGFGKANNIGMRYALDHQADSIVLLNQDARVDPEVLEMMVRQDDGKSLLTPLHMTGDGQDYDFNFKAQLVKSETGLIELLAQHQSLESRYPIGLFNAAFWYLPAGIVREIGGFNPMFPHYGEDNNYYHRLMYFGYHSYVVPQCRMYHDRALHGDQKAFDHNVVLRDSLIVATDVNCSWFGRFIGYLHVLSNHRAHVWSVCSAMMYIFFHLSSIFHNRQEQKQGGETWL